MLILKNKCTHYNIDKKYMYFIKTRHLCVYYNNYYCFSLLLYKRQLSILVELLATLLKFKLVQALFCIE